MHQLANTCQKSSKVQFTFFLFQGVLVFLAAKSGFIKDAEAAAQFQNFIICVEMLIAAVGHLYAFPYKEYAGANIGGSRGLTGSLAHALKLNDFYHDTVHQVSLLLVIIICLPKCSSIGLFSPFLGSYMVLLIVY